MSPFVLTVAIFSVVVGVEAGKKKSSAVASFSDGNGYIEGEITIAKGKWDYDLMITDPTGMEDMLKEMGRECDLFGTPLNFHIHDKWTYGDDKSFGVGTECDAEFTGGHYKTYEDPTCVFDATWPDLPEVCDDEPYPDDKDCCVPTCQPLCDPQGKGRPCKKWQTMQCEVGDLSGKAGQASPDASKNNQIKYEGRFKKDKSMKSKVVKDLKGRSIVFHCGSPRIFCASIQLEQRMVDDSN